MQQKGFDNRKYLTLQSEKIQERISLFGDKLYLEYGGKLFDDHHASRVLPGFEPDSKLKMLSKLKDIAEILVVISANDIIKNKYRSDLGITYDADVLRLIDVFKSQGFYVGSVVMTMYHVQPAVDSFIKRLTALGISVYKHYAIEGYPSDVERIVSADGYGKNEFIPTTRRLVVVTAPGPGSGKMATCLSQLYHENLRGVKAGYAKFETFPVWNLPLAHPINIAYEAATADLNDMNMIDPYHLDAYRTLSVNYNRDVEIFPVVSAMLSRILGYSPYQSPTDMGVNMAGFCITDDTVCQKAARDEIIRRYYAAQCDAFKGRASKETVAKIELLMSKSGTVLENRQTVAAALQKAELTGAPAVAIQLNDGQVITGKTSDLLGASAAALLNALKVLGGIDDGIELISPTIIEPIQKLKVKHMGAVNPRLHTDEILMALSICAVSDEMAKLAIEQLEKLKDCEIHSSVILSHVDEKTFKSLGMHVTCEPKRQANTFYQG